jgi:hypothetical protein
MVHVLCVRGKKNAGGVLVRKPGGKRQLRRLDAACSTHYLSLVFHVCLLAAAVVLYSHHHHQHGKKKTPPAKGQGQHSSAGHCNKNNGRS